VFITYDTETINTYLYEKDSIAGRLFSVQFNEGRLVCVWVAGKTV